MYIARVKKARANAKESKTAIMEGLKSYAKYGAKNPFNNVFTDAELDALKAEDLVKVLHDLANMKHTMLYFGPLSATEFVAKAKPLKQSAGAYVAAKKAVVFEELPTTKNQVLFADFDMKQAEVFWYRSSEVYDSALTPTVSLFNNYFGGGMGSIVFQTIRESKALAYSTYAYYGQPYKKGNRYTVGAYVGTQADKFNDAIKGMNELLDVLPESAKGLDIAKVSLEKSIASERVLNASILGSYLAAQRLGNTTDIRKVVYEEAPKLTYDNLHAFHKKEMSQKPYVYCVVAKEDSLKPADLAKLGEVKKLDLKEIFGY